jgi:hypothetical protein
VSETRAPARRRAAFDDLEQAGDYTGPFPVTGYEDEPRDRRMVYFLLPIHEGATPYDRPTRGSGLHGAPEPPWTFRECGDGSLEIRASIACGRHDVDDDDNALGEYWHGYLDEGNVWRQV